MEKLIKEYSAKAEALPAEFFENLRFANENADWLATEVFPAWDGWDIDNPDNWVLVGEDDIESVDYVNPDNKSLGWFVHLHNGETYYTLSPGKFNKGIELIIAEATDKM